MVNVDISNVWAAVSLPELLGREKEVFDAHQKLVNHQLGGPRLFRLAVPAGQHSGASHPRHPPRLRPDPRRFRGAGGLRRVLHRRRGQGRHRGLPRLRPEPPPHPSDLLRGRLPLQPPVAGAEPAFGGSVIQPPFWSPPPAATWAPMSPPGGFAGLWSASTAPPPKNRIFVATPCGDAPAPLRPGGGL